MNGLINRTIGLAALCYVAIPLAKISAQGQVQRPNNRDRVRLSTEDTRRRTAGQKRTAPRTDQRRLAPNGASNSRTQRPKGAARQPGRTPNLRVAQRNTNQRQGARLPHGFPLTAEQQADIDRILKFWERKTAEIKTFQCSYRRNEFDPARMALQPSGGRREKPASIAIGELRFAEPDKGLMIDSKSYGYEPPKSAKDQPYKELSESFNQHWVCNGKSIFIRDPSQKVLIERRLPPEMQGKAISESPLPFLFGAKAEDMKARYWVRNVTPRNGTRGAFYIEATPKRRDDAQNYERVVIVLEQLKQHQNHLLPVKMQVTYRTIRSNGPDARVLGKRRDEYVFQKHRVNDPRDRARNFFAKFVKPDVPKDWKKQVVDWNGVDRPVANRPKSNDNQASRSRLRPRLK